MQLVNEKFWVSVSSMPSRERPYHHGNLSRALLDAAAELIADVGPSQVSLRELARRTGVSNAAPVHHFGDKAGLYRACVDAMYDEFEAGRPALAPADVEEIGRAHV